MNEFVVKKGNNMPIQSPLIPDPLMPYGSKESITLFAVVEVDERIVKKYLEPTPFEYVHNRCMVYVHDLSTSEKLPYMDAGIVLQVKYKNIIGGHYLFEYEDDDAAIAAGRELFGYPKKYADMTLERNGNMVKGTAIRKGEKIVEIECDLSKPVENLERLKVFPHLTLHTIPKPDGPGIFSQRIISRDNSMDIKPISEELGEAKVTLKSIPTDPLGEFNPIRVLGGGYSVSEFLSSDENGWGKVIETII